MTQIYNQKIKFDFKGISYNLHQVAELTRAIRIATAEELALHPVSFSHAGIRVCTINSDGYKFTVIAGRMGLDENKVVRPMIDTISCECSLRKDKLDGVPTAQAAYAGIIYQAYQVDALLEEIKKTKEVIDRVVTFFVSDRYLDQVTPEVQALTYDESLQPDRINEFISMVVAVVAALDKE